ncbi:MAG TPA: CRTAC1 family protein [Chthonomonadaceae bacterium]|nr:CRTAC1 family protein [Chthonomonadaceae bacterium]
MRRDTPMLFLTLFCLLCLLPGCTPSPHLSAPPPPSQTPLLPAENPPFRFVPVTQQAGIHFKLGHNRKSPLTILETSGGGCAFLDYDNDGWPDILLVGPYNVALYHNEHDGTFKDVTAQSGLDPHRYWMGCAVGDYDGDGLPDIFLTGYHCFALYRNLGGGKFQDVTQESGLTGLDWSLSAAFADFNGDGKLDLYVSQYLKFDQQTKQICEVGNVRSACGPEIYEPLSGKLFLNTDGRHFRAVPDWKDTGKTWGALASDLMGVGQPALYLANDMMQGDLWVRNKAGQWENRGYASGTQGDAQGHLQGGMGVDSGDYDNDGKLDLVVTTYFAQAISLYHNDGNGLFTVTSNATGLGPPTMPYVKFGVGFADLDNDGWLDLMVTNGHVRDNVHDFDSSETYAQPIQVFHNVKGRFTDVSAKLGAVSDLRLVGRGLAFGDYNRDGRVDVLICNLEGEAVLLENQTPPRHWLDVRLNAPNSPNRFGLGALVTLTVNGQSQLREIRTCGSVLSAREPLAHFGLGDATGPVALSIRWPDGKTQALRVEKVDTAVTVSHP